MKSASMYQRDGFLFVGALSETPAGIEIDDGPYLRLPVTASVVDIGCAVKDALARSRRVPHPTDLSGRPEELLAVAQVKTWASFVKRAKFVAVRVESNHFVFTPTRNGGARDGFFYLTTRESRHPIDISPEQLGSAAIGVFELCEL